jgi:nitroreductase
MSMDIFKERRSIRKYEDRPVEDEKLKAVLEAARLAPSWANKQCWTFVVVKDPALKENIASTLENNPAAKAVAAAPVLIVACADPEQSGKMKDQNYYMVDIGISLQQLCLEAWNQGLGTVWIGLFDEDKVRPILGVPDNIRIVAMTPLGYPATQPSERGRKPLEDILFLDKWGKKPAEF